MTCIRAQFFNGSNDEEEDEEDEESQPAVSVTKSSSIKRRYVFLLVVYFLVGIVSGAFLAWSAIAIYLGFPIPFKPILLTVTVDLVLCYCMVRCYDMGKNKKNNQRQLAPQQEVGRTPIVSATITYEDEEEEIDFSLPSNKGMEEAFLRHLRAIDPDFVYVHETPPCPGFAFPPLHHPVVLQASPPCPGFSFSEKRNTAAHVVHASPPCQGFSSSEKTIVVD